MYVICILCCCPCSIFETVQEIKQTTRPQYIDPGIFIRSKDDAEEGRSVTESKTVGPKTIDPKSVTEFSVTKEDSIIGFKDGPIEEDNDDFIEFNNDKVAAKTTIKKEMIENKSFNDEVVYDDQVTLEHSVLKMKK